MALGIALAKAADAPQDIARNNNKITATAQNGGQYKITAPLSELRAGSGPIQLRGARASETLSVPVARGIAIEQAKLRIRAAGSLGMSDQRPHLRVSLNQSLLAQLETPHGATTAANELAFSPSRLHPGYNALTLEAIQRYTDACQDPNAAELWTEIDTLASEVELLYRRRAFDGRLSDLDELLAPSLGGTDALTIVTVNETMSADELKWSVLAVQGLANRMKYRLPLISHLRAAKAAKSAGFATPAPLLDPTRLSGADIVLIGTHKALRPYLVPGAAGVQDAQIQIGPSPADKTHFLLLVTGATPADVTRAATALGLINFPFADAASARISELDIPAGYIPAIDTIVQPERTYIFSDLGFTTTTRSGVRPDAIDLAFDTPADFWVAEKKEVGLLLDFAYGAGMRDDSVVNISVNGVFQTALSLSEKTGGMVDGYKLNLPARAFRPGHNRIQFEVALAARQAGECSAENDRNLLFSLRDSSKITFPPASKFVELPNLRLLGETGFPFAGDAGRPVAVRLADDSDQTVAAALTMMARLGQIHRALSVSTDFGFGPLPRSRDGLVIGARARLSTIGQEVTDLTNVGFVQVSNDAGQGDVQSKTDLSALGGSGLLITGESRASKRHLIAVLTAENPAALLQTTRALVAPARWSQLSGRAIVWRPTSNAVFVQPVRKTFHAGDLDRGLRTSYVLSKHSIWWVLGIGGVLAALAAGLTYYSARLRRADSRQSNVPPS